MFEPGLIDMIMALRSQSISNTAVLRAIEQVPRRHFVPDHLHDMAYDLQALPIACGQSLSDPFTIAVMTQMLELETHHKLLEIGTGSGYHTAILSKMVKRVYSVERYRQLILEAENRFHDLPFDRIIVTCSLIAAPDMLLDQLAPGGMLLGVIDGSLMRFSKARSKVSETELLPLSLPVIEAGKSKAL